MKTTKWLIAIACLVQVSAGCQRNAAVKLDTPTGGSILIAVDETLRPLFEAEEKAFEGLYAEADIRLVYVPESEAAALLVKDSVRMAILGRKLNAPEEEQIRQLKIYPATTKIASDAIALIVHPDNPDTLLSYFQLKDILTGRISRWQELDSLEGAAEGEIQLVFDHEKSSTLRFLKDTVGMEENQPNFFALEDNQEVLEYVAQNPRAIGVIGLSWISDSDDPAVQFSRGKIKVLGISGPGKLEFYQPYQGYVALGVYPFTRDIYVVSREARAGLGSGFTAFLANEKGQRIILKTGLLPATMPIRLVQIAEEFPSLEE